MKMYRRPPWSIYKHRDFKGRITNPVYNRVLVEYKPLTPQEKYNLNHYRSQRSRHLNRRLDYGFTVKQTLKCLKKCWLGYKIARAVETPDEEKHWATFIRRLQFHMGDKNLVQFECLTEDDNKEQIMTSIAEKYAPELMKLPTDYLERLYENFMRYEAEEYGSFGGL